MIILLPSLIKMVTGTFIDNENLGPMFSSDFCLYVLQNVSDCNKVKKYLKLESDIVVNLPNCKSFFCCMFKYFSSILVTFLPFLYNIIS